MLAMREEFVPQVVLMLLQTAAQWAINFAVRAFGLTVAFEVKRGGASFPDSPHPVEFSHEGALEIRTSVGVEDVWCPESADPLFVGGGCYCGS